MNVYAIRAGPRAVLVDFGTGAILDALAERGVTRVDHVFLTHYHRDQWAGLPGRLDERREEGEKSEKEKRSERVASEAEAGTREPRHAHPLLEHARVWVPRHEIRLFADVETFWRTRSYYDMYYFQPTFQVSPVPVPVDGLLESKGRLAWQGHQFTFVETPGHTPGSVTVLWTGATAARDEARHEARGDAWDAGTGPVAFTGDLIHAGGRVYTYYDLEYLYNDNGEGGIQRTLKSLRRLAKHAPRLACPSHGPLVPDFAAARQTLARRLQRARAAFGAKHSSISLWNTLRSAFVKRLKPVNEARVFPHVHQKHFLTARKTTYVVEGHGGHCFLVDFGGCDEPNTIGAGTLFAWLEALGIDAIDFIFPTHYHDDHVGGIPHLRAQHGVPVHALAEMVDVLEHPAHYRLGCLIETPIPVARAFHDGETFTWDDVEFQVFHFPGQTEFHAALHGTIDGHAILFVGDSVTERVWYDNTTNLNCWNWCRLGPDAGYARCARLLQELQPEYLATSHFGILPVTPALLDRYAKVVSAYEDVVAELVPWEDPNFGFDPNWVTFKPVRVEGHPGETVETCLVVRNYAAAAREVRFELNLPPGWRATGESFPRERSVPAGAFAEFPLAVQVPATADPRGRTVLTGDVTFHGRRLGPAADLLVDHGFDPPAEWHGWHPAADTGLMKRTFRHTRTAKRFFK